MIIAGLKIISRREYTSNSYININQQILDIDQHC